MSQTPRKDLVLTFQISNPPWASAAEGREAVLALWIFKHDTDIVERGLMVLFFGLVFFRCTFLWKFFCRRP